MVETALDEAQKLKDEKMIALLQSKGVEMIAAYQNTQALHNFISKLNVGRGDSSVPEDLEQNLDYLLQKGADVNGVNTGYSPWRGNRLLHTLLVIGNFKLIVWAMLRGADPSLKRIVKLDLPKPLTSICYGTSRKPEQTKAFLQQRFHQSFFAEVVESGAASAKTKKSPSTARRLLKGIVKRMSPVQVADRN